MRNTAVARVLTAVDTLCYLFHSIRTIQANDPLLVVHFIYKSPRFTYTQGTHTVVDPADDVGELGELTSECNAMSNYRRRFIKENVVRRQFF